MTIYALRHSGIVRQLLANVPVKPGQRSSCLQADVIPDTLYYYAVFAYDQNNNFAPGTTVATPGAPTGLSATPYNTFNVLRWTTPSSETYQSTILCFRTDRPPMAGLILSSPATWGQQTMSALPRVALWMTRRLAPSMTFTGRDLGIQASDNIPMLVALGRDPLYIRATRVDTIGGVVDLMGRASDAVAEIGEPTLVLLGEHEQVLAPDSVYYGARTFAPSTSSSGSSTASVRVSIAPTAPQPDLAANAASPVPWRARTRTAPRGARRTAGCRARGRSADRPAAARPGNEGYGGASVTTWVDRLVDRVPAS